MAKRNREPVKEEEKRKLNKESLRKLSGIFRFMVPYASTFSIGLIALLISTLTTLAFPRVSGEFLDVATNNSKYFSSIRQVTIVFLSILVLQAIFSFVRVYTFSIVTEKGLADLRKKLYEKYIWLPMRFYDNSRVGELMSRITSDVSTLQDTFSFTLAEFLRQILTLILGAVILFLTSAKLAAFMLLTFPVLVISALIFGKFIRKYARNTQDKLAETNVIVEESLQSISIVKAFTNEAFELRRYAKALDEVIRAALKGGLYRAIFISFIILTISSGIVAVGAYGAVLVQSGSLSVGSLFSFVMYTVFIGFSIAGLGDIYAQLQRSIGASERVLDILGLPDESEKRPGEKLSIQGSIAYNDVNFSYESRPGQPVLSNLNFRIEAGEKIALIGQSGSGKSTIVSLLMRLYPLSQGTITVDGKVITEYPLSGYRENIGIVPQEVILFGGTIEENIRYGKPNATDEDVRSAAEKANALEFIESFPQQFQTVVGERGVKLSGGQRQRIAIARAILKDPRILILDEATSSLDARSELLVQQALEKLMEGRTTIVIAHRLSTIKKVDRIFVIKEGQLAEMGSHAELTQLNNGIYSNLLKLQLQ